MNIKIIYVASRKNDFSDVFFKIGFMPYFLPSNSPLSRYRDRNSESALVFLKQHMQNTKTPFFQYFPEITTYLHFFRITSRKTTLLHIFFKIISE